MIENRPDPDELLASLMNEEEKSKRGKLKIFFGMCAGVGKTFSMLKAAKAEKQKGKDIIIGIIETHNRRETEELTRGFDVIPRVIYDYKSVRISEMNLDAIISRKPELVLVDELGYVPFDRMGAEHLFGFFSQCYEQTSLIVTTNLPFKDWGTLFHNAASASAAERAYKRAGIKNPKKAVNCVELMDCYAYQQPMWMEGLGFCGDGEGGRFIEEGGPEDMHLRGDRDRIIKLDSLHLPILLDHA